MKLNVHKTTAEAGQQSNNFCPIITNAQSGKTADDSPNSLGGNMTGNQGRRQELMEGVLLLSFPPPFPSTPSPPLPSPSPPLSLSFPSPPIPVSFPLSPLPLEVGPLKPARGLGERCKLPQRGPGRKRIWCTLESRAVSKPLVAIILSIRWSEKLD